MEKMKRRSCLYWKTDSSAFLKETGSNRLQMGEGKERKEGCLPVHLKWILSFLSEKTLLETDGVLFCILHKMWQ